MAKLVLDKPKLVLDKPPDYGMIALPKGRLPGVWDYDKQLDDLLGDPEIDIEDMLPLDVRYDFGKIIGMTEKPDETKEKMKNSLYYSIQFGIPPDISFNLIDKLMEMTKFNPAKAKLEDRGFFGKIAESWRRGDAQVMGDISVYETAFENMGDEERALATLKKLQLEQALDPIEGWFLADLVYSGVEVVPGMARGYWSAIPKAFAGMATGAGMALAAGQVPPLTLAPEEIVGVPAGALVGAKFGLMAGSAMFWYKQGAGSMYATMRENDYNPELSKHIAGAAAVPYAIVEFLQVSQLTPGLRRGALNVAQKSMLKVVANATKKYGTVWGTEVFEEVVQEIIQIGAEDISGYLSEKLKLPKGVSEFLLERGRRIWETTKEAGKAMALLPIPGATIDIYTGKKAIVPTEAVAKPVEKPGVVEVKVPPTEAIPAPEKPVAPITKPKEGIVPQGWKMEVKPKWRKEPGWQSEVDWENKIIVFESKADLEDIAIVNHEIAHISIEDKIGYIKDISESPLLKEYATITGELDVHRNFVREHLAMDYGNYLTDPSKVSPQLTELFNKYFPVKPEAVEVAPEGKEIFYRGSDITEDLTRPLPKHLEKFGISLSANYAVAEHFVVPYKIGDDTARVIRAYTLSPDAKIYKMTEEDAKTDISELHSRVAAMGYDVIDMRGVKHIAAEEIKVLNPKVLELVRPVAKPEAVEVELVIPTKAESAKMSAEANRLALEEVGKEPVGLSVTEAQERAWNKKRTAAAAKHFNRLIKKFQAQPVAKAEPTKVEKLAERPIQKAIKIEKEIIPKQSKENFTPSEVQKEIETQVPDSDSETQNAANLMEGYWREYDERELEINVATIKNQEAITKALDKKIYAPESDIETSKMSQAMMLYIDLKEHPSGRQFAEEISKSQKGIYELSKNLPARIQKIADSIIQQNREAGALAIDKEIIANARENYIAHLWQKPTRKEALRVRFRTTTARAKERTLEGGIMEGWAKGKTLRVKDVTLATQIAQSQINQAIVGRELLKMGKKWGLLSHKQPENWVRVEHPGFTTWKWSGKAEKAKTYGRNFFVTEKGDLMERVPVYAEPELGKKLNKVFTPSALYKVPGIETISRYNAQIKSTILFTSLYHHQAFLRSYAFGSRGLNPKTAYEKGRQSIMNMTPEVRLLVRNGLTIGRIQDYDPRMIEGEQTIWGKALAQTKPTEVVREKLVALRKRQERFLFNKMGPALKIQAGILELKAALKRNQAELESGEITADEIAAAVANLMNNDFGGLHLGRMGRSQTAQHIFRLLALAPDWTESNIRSAVDAFRKGETGYLHRMFWGRIAAKGLGATILFNLLLSAFDDDDFAERYRKAWETGRLRWLDIDITPIYEAMGGTDDKRKYFSLLGHFRDPVKFVVHPFISMKHKGSVVSRVMLDMMIGQDWAGREFTTIGELLGITEDGKNSGRLVKYSRSGAKPIEPAQIPSYALYQVRSAMPIPMQNLIAFLGGELDAFDAVTKSLGLMTATTYPERKRKPKKITR